MSGVGVAGGASIFHTTQFISGGNDRAVDKQFERKHHRAYLRITLNLTFNIQTAGELII